jgi:hypothetical protein
LILSITLLYYKTSFVITRHKAVATTVSVFVFAWMSAEFGSLIVGFMVGTAGLKVEVVIGASVENSGNRELGIPERQHTHVSLNKVGSAPA